MINLFSENSARGYKKLLECRLNEGLTNIPMKLTDHVALKKLENDDSFELSQPLEGYELTLNEVLEYINDSEIRYFQEYINAEFQISSIIYTNVERTIVSKGKFDSSFGFLKNLKLDYSNITDEGVISNLVNDLYNNVNDNFDLELNPGMILKRVGDLITYTNSPKKIVQRRKLKSITMS